MENYHLSEKNRFLLLYDVKWNGYIIQGFYYINGRGNGYKHLNIPFRFRNHLTETSNILVIIFKKLDSLYRWIQITLYFALHTIFGIHFSIDKDFVHPQEYAHCSALLEFSYAEEYCVVFTFPTAWKYMQWRNKWRNKGIYKLSYYFIVLMIL